MRGISQGLGLGLAASDGRSKREDLLVFLAIVFPFLLLLRLLVLYARLSVRACCYEVWMGAPAGASAGARCGCVRVNVCGQWGRLSSHRLRNGRTRRLLETATPEAHFSTIRHAHSSLDFGPGQVTSGYI